MESLNDIEVFQEFCKMKNKYGIYVSYDSKELGAQDIKMVVPFLSEIDYLWTRTMFLFGAKQERDDCFSKISGHDESMGVKYDQETKIYSRMIN